MTQRVARRVLLIGWDAADWKVITPLLEAGKMPYLERLVNGGVMGNLATLQPVLSPILWTSIATGKRADKHGILGFVEPDESGGKLRPVTSTSRACKALWNILSQSGLASAVVGWFATHPPEPINGCVVTDHYEHTIGPRAGDGALPPGTVHPTELQDTMAELRVRPTDLTPEQLLPFVPNAAKIDQKSDRRLLGLAKTLAECSTIHHAATWLAEHETWDLLAVYYDAIDHFCHGFMRYHPPKLPHISDADFEMYRGVVDAAYRFHDMMLGRLMHLVGPETTIMLVSDHGFHSDHLRPLDDPFAPGRRGPVVGDDPVSHHRNYGVVMACGPGIRRDERVYGATLLDVAPTILGMLGLPVPDDMDGKVLTQIFDPPIEPARIDSYEGPHPDDGRRADVEAEDPWAAQQMLQHLVELGYVDPPGEDEAANVRRAVDDRKANLAIVHFSAGRVSKALAIYRDLMSRHDNAMFKLRAARCLTRLGEVDEAKAMLQEVIAERPNSPPANLLLGSLHLESGEVETALEHLAKAEQADPKLPHLHERLGLVYARQRRWEDAERACRRALDIDGDSPAAHDTLGLALRNLGRPDDAVFHHMCSVSLLHNRPMTHVHLGMALVDARQLDWALRAFHVALELDPDCLPAHDCLARCHAQMTGDAVKAAHHRSRAEALRQKAAQAVAGPSEDRVKRAPS